MMQERRVTADGRILERDGQGNVRVVGRVDGQGGPVVMPAPATQQFEAPQAQANVERTQTQTDIDRAKAPAEIRKTQADALKAEVEAGEVAQEAALWQDKQEKSAIREAFKTDAILRAIRNARGIVRSEGGVGVESLLRALPTTTARKLESELAPIKGNLAFGNLKQMRDESKTGAAVGNVTERELDLLASTVASLDQGVDAETFLRRLDEIERYFIGMQVSALGLDPNSAEGRDLFKRDYGYTGVFDGEMNGNRPDLADANARQTEVQIPEEYQREHLRYLRDNWGRIDANDYVRFRAGLDQAFGLNPDLGAYEKAVGDLNAAAADGVPPEGAGAVPNPVRDLSMGEQAINYAAQSAPGAAFASATNAFAGGLPARLGGQQDNLELLREVRPGASAVGEFIGAGAGPLALGGAGTRFGSKFLGNPFISETTHGTLYGATQDDNALRGAGMGFVGSAGGAALGRKVGELMPEWFAPNAVRNADESVPSANQLKEEASNLYADVQAQGIAAAPEATSDMYQRARTVLANNGRIGGDGRAIIQDGPTRQAFEQLESFDGLPMTPTQAQTVRETLGEGLTSNVPKERRIASQLLEDFDEWAAPVMPGAEQAREVSSRYIRGQQLEGLTDKAIARGNRLRGSDDAAQVRTMFGQLDERIQGGQAFFDPPTAEAIARVAQGDGVTNALRWVGKFSPQNVIPAMGQGVGVAGSAATGNPVPAMVAGGMAATGLFGRKVSNARTMRAAEEARLLALGGREYQEALQAAIDRAAMNAGRFFGGAGGSVASMTTR